mmetsp:Transcript_10704/g.15095  ORF Transcript_10704/g.15095 Transcript_10704/m.15095 type:complete len:216 (-) Transcript_10704:808-1455(-)
MVAARKCICRAERSTWWNRNAGSRPFFWRWPAYYRSRIRDGVPISLCGQLPNHQTRQQHVHDPTHFRLIQEKVDKLRQLEYVQEGLVESLISVFDVPKTDEDIRLVYNGTSCGLNGSVVDPWFAVPTMDSLSRGLEAGMFMGDANIGDQFHNFMLHETMRPYIGVDFSQFPREIGDLPRLDNLWHYMHINSRSQGEIWARMCMGFPHRHIVPHKV